MGLALIPIGLDEAIAFVARYHRHHQPVVGHKHSMGAALGQNIIGVVIVGRPVSRLRDDGRTLEVTRLCTDGEKHPTGKTNRSGEPTFYNACSFLYNAAAKWAFAGGYTRIGTYILKSESGKSLGALGGNWRLVAETPGRSWSVPSRPRVDKHPLEPRLLYEATT
jgi:hypothetical protein